LPISALAASRNSYPQVCAQKLWIRHRSVVVMVVASALTVKPQSV